ncbi:serine/threonine protein kinase [Streptomyces purpurogeneiscleroticus]|nr:serine/threonine-protein kinase [Streptomyces purpurogeneiscleroticus]MBZ4018610.1 serine/threonine protein kinase [Streptomyces purpurogeneiscleroticus]
MGSFGGHGRLIAGRYRLDGRLGRGGMGTVWRATDELLGRQVAVKELNLDDDRDDADTAVQRERMLREARTVAQIKHPNVIVVHDVVMQDERPWLVMELVDGGSLADRLGSGGPLAPREAARIGVALLGALRVAHARGVLHRDIKPANVLLEAGTGRVVLTDFGIAQVPGATTLTESGAFVGSPEYTAPERMAGRSTGPEGDLWSLGVLLCAVLSGGETPFHRDSIGGVLHAVVSDDIRIPEAAGPLYTVVAGLLRRDTERRLTVAATERLLRGYLQTGRMPEPGGAPTAEERPPLLTPARQPAPLRDAFDGRALAAAARPHTGRTRNVRNVLLAVTAALALAAAGAGIAALVLNGRGADDGRTPATRSPQPTPTATKSPGQGGTATPTPTATSAPTAPAGYATVRDPQGFALAVPDGFSRSYEKPRVYYYSAGRRFRLGIHVQPPQQGGPLGTMRDAHINGPQNYRGYRDGKVTATTHNGHRAALWQFTWDGGPEDGGPRRTYDLSWDEGGRMYDVWISAPDGDRTVAKRHFDTALATFRALRPPRTG